jgi:hypothetical protein
MLNGESPYQRATFRYTPLLAILLTPCHFNSLGYLSQIWGKLLFATADIITGVFIEKILQLKGVEAGTYTILSRNLLYTAPKDLRWNLNAGLWMLNPFVAGMSMLDLGS